MSKHTPEFSFVLASTIATALFSCGDEPNSPCQRIEFLGGEYPDNEIPQGGLNKDSLINFLYRIISETTAPDLLEALEDIATDPDYTNPESMVRIAKAAIAKARGKK